VEVDRGTVVVFPELEVLVPLDVLPLVEVLPLPLLEDVEPPDLPVLLPPPLLFPPPPPPLRRSKCLYFGRLALTNGMNIVESPSRVLVILWRICESCEAGERESRETHWEVKLVQLFYRSNSVKEEAVTATSDLTWRVAPLTQITKCKSTLYLIIYSNPLKPRTASG
jgi:hypothetical protein